MMSSVFYMKSLLESSINLHKIATGKFLINFQLVPVFGMLQYIEDLISPLLMQHADPKMTILVR